jgi:hypothetical protein
MSHRESNDAGNDNDETEVNVGATVHIVLTERSPLDGRYIFASILYEGNHLRASELALYNWYWNRVAWQPHYTFTVYLPLQECLERIRARDNHYETDENYFVHLYNNYCDFIGVDRIDCDGGVDGSEIRKETLAKFIPRHCIYNVENRQGTLEDNCTLVFRTLSTLANSIAQSVSNVVSNGNLNSNNNNNNNNNNNIDTTVTDTFTY